MRAARGEVVCCVGVILMADVGLRDGGVMERFGVEWRVGIWFGVGGLVQFAYPRNTSFKLIYKTASI